MQDNEILDLDEAARRLHATPDTLLQYIRRCDLLAARVGKNMVILHADLVCFVRAVAARQHGERTAKLHHQSLANGSQDFNNLDTPSPAFIQLAESPFRARPMKRKGRRTHVPPLPPDGA